MVEPLPDVEGECQCHCLVLSEEYCLRALLSAGGVGVFFGLFLATLCWKGAAFLRRIDLRWTVAVKGLASSVEDEGGRG